MLVVVQVCIVGYEQNTRLITRCGIKYLVTFNDGVIMPSVTLAVAYLD